MMKHVKLSALLLSVLLVVSLAVPSASAAEGAARAEAAYETAAVTVEVYGLEKNTAYSRISVRKDGSVVGIGMGRTDAGGVLRASIPVGYLENDHYEVHVYNDRDGTVAAFGSFDVPYVNPLKATCRGDGRLSYVLAPDVVTGSVTVAAASYSADGRLVDLVYRPVKAAERGASGTVALSVENGGAYRLFLLGTDSKSPLLNQRVGTVEAAD